MKKPTVVLDSCVLYPAPLRDFLMHLTLLDLFHAKWTNAIHDEWIRSVLKARPDLKREQLERTKHLMNSSVRDCLVEDEDYDYLIEIISLPDKDDRHVLAAAMHTTADTILTFNLKDFPQETLENYGIKAKHPDEFIVSLLETDWRKVSLAAERQRANLKKPPKTREEFLQTLRQQGLNKTCEILAKLL